MNKNHYILILLASLFIGACSDCNSDKVLSLVNDNSSIELKYAGTELPIDEFAAFIANKENDLTKNKEISDINFQLSFMPKEYLGYLEIKNENFSKEELDEAITHYEGMSYFNFRLHLAEGQGELLKYKLASAQQYEARIRYMSFEMQKDICLVQGADTLYPGMFHFERIFEVAPYATVMVAFDNQKFNPKNEFTIVYNDKLFNKGFIKYAYKQNQLIDLPKISGV